jgi:hypothetical protein
MTSDPLQLIVFYLHVGPASKDLHKTLLCHHEFESCRSYTLGNLSAVVARTQRLGLFVALFLVEQSEKTKDSIHIIFLLKSALTFTVRLLPQHKLFDIIENCNLI